MTHHRRRIARIALAGLTGLFAAACGDGVDEGLGRTARGTIDGVPLHTVEPGTVPPESDGDDGDDGDDGVFTVDPDDPFAWFDVGDGIEEGQLEVPLDYDDPSGDTLLLTVARHRAVDPDQRIGTLLVNPGGPGFSGTGLAYGAESIYGQDVLDRFDIVGWSPRGTGYVQWVDCIDDYDPYFGIDSSPDTVAEFDDLVAAAEGFAEGCAELSGDLLPHIGTADSARDMNAIREALGEDTISYFGFSYGSELGAVWATMFPDTVRAVVLDGAADPTVNYLQQQIQQAAGNEAAFATFLTQCSAAPDCAFHNDGNAEGAFDRLHAEIDANPVVVERDRTPVTQGVLLTAVAESLYDASDWPRLEAALADLQDGDGAAILELYDQYYGYWGDGWDDALEAYFAISCLDDPGATSVEELFSHEAEFVAAAPRFGRAWMAELVICAVWPEPQARYDTITGAGAGPILVVGTTGDAATPLESSRNMARALEDGHLVVVNADQHTGYGVNRCVEVAVDGYLVDPEAPLADEIDCQ